MKKILFTLFLIVLTTFVLVGCEKPYAEIVDGKLVKEDEKTLVSIEVEIVSGLTGYWEMYPELHSILLDNLGNEYRALDVLPGANFSGKFDDKGVYSGTLVFPKLDPEASIATIRIEQVLYYAPNSGMYDFGYHVAGNYVVSFKFSLDKNNMAYIEIKEKDTGKVVQRESFKLNRVTVSTEKGDVITEFKVNR